MPSRFQRIDRWIKSLLTPREGLWAGIAWTFGAGAASDWEAWGSVAIGVIIAGMSVLALWIQPENPTEPSGY